MPMTIQGILRSLRSLVSGSSGFREKYLRVVTLQRANIALARGAATSAARVLDTTNPRSWEFCAFSQNQEDGIIDYLCRKLREPNRCFLEIGVGDGLENNTAWLAIALRYNGVMIDGNPVSIEHCQRLLSEFTLNVQGMNMFVEPESCREIAALALRPDLDFLSLDIDGIDYFVMRALLGAGLRPKILAVEYNSAYGPLKPISVAYKATFRYLEEHPSGLYYGTSVSGWRALLEPHGYRFLSVDSNGVNAFFVDPNAFDVGFVDNVRGMLFRENFYQASRYRTTWEAQFELIKGLPFHDIS